MKRNVIRARGIFVDSLNVGGIQFIIRRLKMVVL